MITITGAVLFALALAIRATITEWVENGLVEVVNPILVTLISSVLGVFGLLVLFIGLVVEVLL